MVLQDTSPPPPEKSRDFATDNDTAQGAAVPRGWSAWFGGPNTQIGPRIAPVLGRSATSDSDTDDSSSAILDKQFADEEGRAIQYRTCSWQKVLCTPAIIAPKQAKCAPPAYGCRIV